MKVHLQTNRRPIFVFIILTVVMCSVILSSCRATELEVSTDDGILANNDIADFYFYYPSEFTLDKNAAMISVYVADDEWIPSNIEANDEAYHIPVHPNLSALVYRLDEGAYESIDDYWERDCLPLMQNIFTTMDITDTQDLVIDNFAARRYDYIATLAGMEYQYSQILIMRDDFLYTLTYTATPKKFDQYINALDTAVRTFAFK